MRTDCRTLVWIAALMVAAPCARAQDVAGPMKTVTLAVKQRLGLPFMRVAVDADHPLKLAGRAQPLTFTVAGEVLHARLTVKPGPDTELKAGDAVVVELDPAAGGGAPDHHATRTLTVRRGVPAAGEPPWSIVDLDVLEGKIGGEAVWFLDHDCDGTFLTGQRDIIVRKADGALTLIEPVVVVARNVFDLTCNEAAATAVSKPNKAFVTPDCFPAWGEVAQGLAHINDIRAAMNLPPFGLSRQASRAALLHARYCTLNSFGHFEAAGKPGFTEEGAKAGPDSIGTTGGSVVGGIDGFIATLFHRMPLIDPRLCEIGIGTDGTYCWIEYVSGAKRPWEAQGPVIFPGPGHSWTTGTFASEDPDPLPAGTARGVGLPVTCAWYGGETITNAKGVLRMDKEVVDCFHHDATAKDLRSMMDPELHVTLMARKPLRYRPYAFTLEWTDDGKPFKLDYAFHIGKR